MISKKTIGEELKRFLESNELTYFDVSKKIGISKSHVAQIVSGDRNPSEKVIKTIANVLKVKPFYFREYRLMILNDYIKKHPELIDCNSEDELKEILICSSYEKIKKYEKKFKGKIKKGPSFLEEALMKTMNLKKIPPGVMQRAFLSSVLKLLIETVYNKKINEKELELYIDILNKFME